MADTPDSLAADMQVGENIFKYSKKKFIILESSDNTTETAENAQEVPATNTAQTNHQETSPEPEQRQIRLIFGSKLKNLTSRTTQYK